LAGIPRLAISWKKGTRASEHEFKVYHLPAEGLTEAQIKTLKTLLEELEAEWDGATGLASGSASPSVGEGWLSPETGESLTTGFQTSRQKREAKLREHLEAERAWAEAEGLPEWLVDEATERGDFECRDACLAPVGAGPGRGDRDGEVPYPAALELQEEHPAAVPGDEERVVGGAGGEAERRGAYRVSSGGTNYRLPLGDLIAVRRGDGNSREYIVRFPPLRLFWALFQTQPRSRA